MNTVSSGKLPHIKLQAEATASYDYKGRRLALGQKMTRYGVGKDARFFVAIRLIEGLSLWNRLVGFVLGTLAGRLVEVKIGKQTLLFNVASISKRLHLEESAVKEAARQGTLLSLIEQHTQEMEKVLFHYDQIFKQYVAKPKVKMVGNDKMKFKDMLETKEAALETGLTPHVLMKAIRQGLSIQWADNQETQLFAIKDRKFIVHKEFNSKGLLQLSCIGEQIEESQKGQHFEFINLTDAKKNIFVQPQNTLEAKDQLERLTKEHQLLSKIHANGEAWGIQPPSRKIVNLSQAGLVGYLRENQTCHLSFHPRRPELRDRLVEFHQLLSGLDHLADQHILHGNINRENILVNKILHIKGFDQAIDALTETDLSKIAAHTNQTLSHVCPQDLVLSDVFVNQGRKEELIELKKAQDVFALGVVFYQMLTKGNLPYDLDTEGYPQPSSFHELPPHIPQDLRDLITHMLAIDYTKRPTANEALQFFNLFMETEYSAVYEDIQTTIQKEYKGSYRKEKKESKEIVLAHYERLLDQFAVQKDGSLVRKKDNLKTGLTPQTLKKVVKAAFSVAPFQATAIEQPDRRLYNIWYDKNSEELEIGYVNNLIGVGGFGKVFTYVNLTRGTTEVIEEAFKYAKKQKGLEAKRDIQNEYQVLSDLGRKWGIQIGPRRIGLISKTSKKGRPQKYGYLSTGLYDNTYVKEVKTAPTLENYLFGFHQLLFGLDCLGKQDILHGDIKPENILMMQTAEGHQLVHLADFGGARNARKITTLRKLAGGAGSSAITPGYAPLEDIELAQRFVKQNQREQLIELEKKRDVFALGAVLYLGLTGKKPFQTDKRRIPGQLKSHGFPILSTYQEIDAAIADTAERQALIEQTPQVIKDLIKNMLDPDYTKRPSHAQALHTLETALQSQYPDLFQKIQDCLSNYGK